MAIFPGGVGDFLCCLPALAARRPAVRGQFAIVGRDAWLSLIAAGPFRPWSIESRAISELYGVESGAAAALFAGAAEIHSWTGYGDRALACRLEAVSGGARVGVYPFRAFQPGEHAVDYYARCLGVCPAPPRTFVGEAARGWARGWLARHNPGGRPLLLVHAGSGSREKNWHGFGEIAGWWRERGGCAAEIVGPAEQERPRLRDADAVVDQELPRVAALLERAAAYAGNDSGVTHLAAAAGTRGIAVYRAAAVPHWGPRSDRIAVVSARDRCPRDCGPGLCLHRVPVDAVLAAIRRLWRGGAHRGAHRGAQC